MNILDHANILEDFSQTSYEEWQAKRQVQQTIGGSEAAILLGQSAYKDEYTLYLEKRGEVAPSPSGEAAEWGHALEPIVAYAFLKKHPELTIEEFPYLLQSKNFPWMSANIDRLIRKEDLFGILECKTASEFLDGEWESGEILLDGTGHGKVPPRYYTQLQHYFVVTGLSWGHFACLVGANKLYGNNLMTAKEFTETIEKYGLEWGYTVCMAAGMKFYEVYVERNHPYTMDVIDKELLFTQRVELGIPPKVNGSDSCKEVLGSLYAVPNEEFLELEEDQFGEWLQKRAELKDLLSQLEEELNLIENNIKSTIADHKGVVWNGYKVTWGLREGKASCDLALLQEKYPDVFAEVVKKGKGYRQLSVSQPKKKKAKGA